MLGGPLRDPDLRPLLPHARGPDAGGTRGHPRRYIRVDIAASPPTGPRRPPAPRTMIRGMGRAAQGLFRWLRRAFVTLLLLLAIFVLYRAWEAKRRPFLKAWHRFAPPSEVRAADLTERFTIEDYLRREDQVFREVDENISQRLAPEDRTATNRYFSESLTSPRRFPRDWNRTFEMVPDGGEIRGGALLLHGLTDAPYSMRRLAEILKSEGIYCLGLRVPGHGTVPGALTKAVWEDWSAATRVGVRHVRRRIGDGQAALSRRLLERRRALGQVRARRRRGREPPARRTNHPPVPDDRRHAGRRLREVRRRPRRRFRISRRRAGSTSCPNTTRSSTTRSRSTRRSRRRG